mmetsp:Transcript_43543/g.137290  ORF Transcript_43543/g.137290 Transcript_43543/m.137290 type:complete len:458 (+) Transcript_43543:44-1417(+)
MNWLGFGRAADPEPVEEEQSSRVSAETRRSGGLLVDRRHESIHPRVAQIEGVSLGNALERFRASPPSAPSGAGCSLGGGIMGGTRQLRRRRDEMEKLLSGFKASCSVAGPSRPHGAAGSSEAESLPTPSGEAACWYQAGARQRSRGPSRGAQRAGPGGTSPMEPRRRGRGESSLPPPLQSEGTPQTDLHTDLQTDAQTDAPQTDAHTDAEGSRRPRRRESVLDGLRRFIGGLGGGGGDTDGGGRARGSACRGGAGDDGRSPGRGSPASAGSSLLDEAQRMVSELRAAGRDRDADALQRKLHRAERARASPPLLLCETRAAVEAGMPAGGDRRRGRRRPNGVGDEQQHRHARAGRSSEELPQGDPTQGGGAAAPWYRAGAHQQQLARTERRLRVPHRSRGRREPSRRSPPLAPWWQAELRRPLRGPSLQPNSHSGSFGGVTVDSGDEVLRPAPRSRRF